VCVCVCVCVNVWCLSIVAQMPQWIELVFVVWVTTEDSCFVLAEGQDPPTERKISPQRLGVGAYFHQKIHITSVECDRWVWPRLVWHVYCWGHGRLSQQLQSSCLFSLPAGLSVNFLWWETAQRVFGQSFWISDIKTQNKSTAPNCRC